jgi:transposase
LQSFWLELQNHKIKPRKVYDELGLCELIDQMIYQDDDKRNVSLGQAVIKAMVLNGLGFANQTLYLMPHFFKDKPVGCLTKKNIIYIYK